MLRLIPGLHVIGRRPVTRAVTRCGRRRPNLARSALPVLVLALVAGCGSQPHNSAAPPAATTAVAGLSPAQLAGQRVIYSYSGTVPPASLLSLISHGEAAGVIFFTENYGSWPKFAAAVRELDRAAASQQDPVRLPLLLMTDQEGGEISRLPGPPVPAARDIGQAADPQAAAAQAGASVAATLRGYGLTANLAPVLDVYRQPGNFIDQFRRSFSGNPATVARLGAAYAQAEQRAGVAATVKHFPGLGAAAQPQNTDIRPVTIQLPAATIRGVDELPYRSAIAAHVRLVMLSWAVYPALDPAFPAGLSAKIVQGELRRGLGFTGVTMTDALEAGALRPFGPIAARATLAAWAGLDLLLCSQRNVAEGASALRSLERGYLQGSLNHAAFRAADERIMALRAALRASPGRAAN